MCQKMELVLNALQDAPSVSHPPQKMVPPYSLGTYPPKTQSIIEALLLFHQEKIDFLKASFFDKLLKQLWSRQKLTYFKIGHEMS